VSDTLFTTEASSFVPTAHARGPWDPQALHGGAPAALITDAFEAHEPGPGMGIARLNFELLRPVPMSPLDISIEVVRAGRRVQELDAELRSGGRLICRASALLVARVPGDLPAGAAGEQGERMPAPEEASELSFALEAPAGADPAHASFGATGMQMRWIDDPYTPGPCRVWMRPRRALLPGRELSPLACAAAVADFGNGVSATLPFEHYLFINADLTLHLAREPRGDWIGLNSRTILHEGGMGIAESALHDREGPIGRAFQTLVVAPR
jgi:hypothetical protein